jgi:nucleoid-associated protein YgaU
VAALPDPETPPVANPGAEAVPPAERPASVDEHPAAAATPCAPIEVRVVPGSTLSSIARDVYGYLPEGAEYARFTSRVKTLNPWLTDPNLIFADRTLRVPGDARASGAGGNVAP